MTNGDDVFVAAIFNTGFNTLYSDIEGPANPKGEDDSECFVCYSLTSEGQAILLSEYATRIANGPNTHAILL